jgi:hypothetical protein
MKASTIAQFNTEIFIQMERIGFNKDEALKKISDYTLFGNMIFTHEKIIELFEGWIYEGKYEDTKYDTTYYTYLFKKNTQLGWGQYKNQSYKISVHGGTYTLYEKEKGYPQHSNNPKTVDNFISDCQRANIELIIKDEIENKIFNL